MDKTTNISSAPKSFYVIVGGIISAALAIGGWGMRKDCVETEARSSLLNRINFPDQMPPTCKTSTSPRVLTKTLAPLFDLQDVNTGLTGQTLVAHALNRGVDFVVCDDMSSVTATFEKQASGYVLKLNAQAHDLQQQAAVLQLMKEFYNTGPAYATPDNGGQQIVADPLFVRSMPGRILEEHDLKDYIAAKPVRQGTPVRIPMRSFAENAP